MKKQQYVAAVACLAAGVIGFVSVYATEKAQERKNEIAQEQTIEATEQVSAASNELESQSSKDARDAIRKAQIAKAAQEEKKDEEKSGEPKKEPEAKATVAAETFISGIAAIVLEPTGSPVRIYSFITAANIFSFLSAGICLPALSDSTL